MNWLMLGGSLVAVLALAACVRWLGLGGDVRITDRADGLRIANDNGFAADDIVIDRAGVAALARNAQGQFFLLRRHGVHFVGHRLSAPLNARLDQRFLTIGQTTLDLGEDAAIWAASLRRMAA
jgi:hypothetical protein